MKQAQFLTTTQFFNKVGQILGKSAEENYREIVNVKMQPLIPMLLENNAQTYCRECAVKMYINGSFQADCFHHVLTTNSISNVSKSSHESQNFRFFSIFLKRTNQFLKNLLKAQFNVLNFYTFC